MQDNKTNDIAQDLMVLSNFLIENKNVNHHGMNITMTHGFLYSMIASPCIIMPSDWLFVIFGGFPEFKDVKQQEQIYVAALALHDFVKNRLTTATKADLCLWQPSGAMVNLKLATDATIVDFCAGYVKGYLLDPILKDSFADLPDLSLAFFLAVINVGTSTAEQTQKIDNNMRETLCHMIVDNYTNWSQFHQLNLGKTYFQLKAQD